MQTPDFARAGLTEAEVETIAGRPTSIGDLIERRVAETPDLVGFKYPDPSDTWTDVTFRDFRDWVHRVAAGLLALGVEPEDRLAIMSSTRIEWVVADLANNCAGGATTTVYPNTTHDDLDYILEHSGSRIAVLENTHLLERVRADEALASRLTKIILLDGDDPADDVLTFAELERLGRDRLADDPECVRRAIAATGPDTLATLIYTSGTTGRPKGVELTHDNWVFEAYSMKTLDLLSTDDVHYLWLPMSHVFGKDLIGVDLAYGTCTAVDGRIDKIIDNLAIVRPTLMCGAPRIYEKVRAAVLTQNTGLKGRIARWAFHVGRESRQYRLAGKPLPRTLRARYAVADKLVFTKLREKMGGRLRFFISGSAKLSEQVQAWFYSAGILIIEGYGSTETTAIAFLNNPKTPRFGTVGTVAPGSEVRLADDGEILLRGPNITRGYHDAPDVTAESFTDDWFHTGDIGELDGEGNLTITDRKKDLMKTSGGKYVSPQKVENAIVANCPYVAQAIVVGEGRKYVSALVVMDPDGLMKFAAKRNLGDKSYAELSQLPEIRSSIERYIELANSHLERWETVKRFAILDHELSVDDGDVTPNMKVRRTKVAEHYRDLVDTLYDAEPED